jgi:hypothetical protein
MCLSGAIPLSLGNNRAAYSNFVGILFSGRGGVFNISTPLFVSSI